MAIAILGGAGLGHAGRLVLDHWPGRWSARRIFGTIAAACLAHFLVYLPLVRETGEEAWAARADVKYAEAFAHRLPPNSFVLTHNPAMFHIWNVAAGQMSMVTTDSNRAQQLFARYKGGVYLHWNFWCNVHDPVQTGFCRAVLDGFPHETVDSRREREYEYVFYRLQPRESRWTPMTTRP